MAKQVPMLCQSALTGKWMCITKYKTRPDGTILASEKFDVTTQVEKIIDQAVKAANMVVGLKQLATSEEATHAK